jgi:hypothetical protein
MDDSRQFVRYPAQYGNLRLHNDHVRAQALKNRYGSIPIPKPILIDNFTLTRRDRFWEVRDPAGELVCITVYKCGAQEVIRRLREKEAPSQPV